MDDIVYCLEPATQAVVAKNAALLFIKYEAKNRQHFNYYLTAMAKKKLSTAGVFLSPYTGVAHMHPACVTLENYLSLNVFPNFLDSRFYSISIKRKKLQLLVARKKKRKFG